MKKNSAYDYLEGMGQNCKKLINEIRQLPLTDKVDQLARNSFLQYIQIKMDQTGYGDIDIEQVAMSDLAEVHSELLDKHTEYSLKIQPEDPDASSQLNI